MDSFVITSTPLWSNLSAKNLLDFNLNTPFYTIEEKFAWLIVDMQVMQKISFVILYMKNNAQATNTPWVRIGSRYLYQAPGGTAFMANNSLCAENVTRVGTIITYNCMKILVFSCFEKFLINLKDSMNTYTFIIIPNLVFYCKGN